jgi:predicted trehalose synthase
MIEYKDTNTNKKDTYIDNDGVPMCPNCKKVYKSRTSIYTHMKTCGVVAAPAAPAPTAMTEARQIASPETLTLTPEQIQHILIENRILKELLKNVIQGINPPILAGPK